MNGQGANEKLLGYAGDMKPRNANGLFQQIEQN